MGLLKPAVNLYGETSLSSGEVKQKDVGTEVLIRGVVTKSSADFC